MSGDASAEEDAILEELAMISSQRSNAEVNMAAIATVETEEEEEECPDELEEAPATKRVSVLLCCRGRGEGNSDMCTRIGQAVPPR